MLPQEGRSAASFEGRVVKRSADSETQVMAASALASPPRVAFSPPPSSQVGVAAAPSGMCTSDFFRRLSLHVTNLFLVTHVSKLRCSPRFLRNVFKANKPFANEHDLPGQFAPGSASPRQYYILLSSNFVAPCPKIVQLYGNYFPPCQAGKSPFSKRVSAAHAHAKPWACHPGR